MEGSNYNDVLRGFSGNDVIDGWYGDDILDGGSGSDTLNGGGGNDTLIGGTGNDVFLLGASYDAVVDASGVDTIESTISRSLVGYSTIENLRLTGGGAKNGTGNSLGNILTGNSSVNALNGGLGMDVLTGGLGRDMLTGGNQHDVFDFNLTSETGVTSATRDVIKDFGHLLDDIDLRTIDASPLLSGNNNFVWRGTAAFSTSSAGEVRFQKFNNAGTANDYTMVYGDTDKDTSSEFQIKLMGLVSLTSADFVL